MIIIIQDKERKVSIKTHNVVIHEVLDDVLRLLVSYGFAQKSVDDAIVEMADEIQSREGLV